MSIYSNGMRAPVHISRRSAPNESETEIVLNRNEDFGRAAESAEDRKKSLLAHIIYSRLCIPRMYARKLGSSESLHVGRSSVFAGCRMFYAKKEEDGGDAWNRWIYISIVWTECNIILRIERNKRDIKCKSFGILLNRSHVDRVLIFVVL